MDFHQLLPVDIRFGYDPQPHRRSSALDIERPLREDHLPKRRLCGIVSSEF